MQCSECTNRCIAQGHIAQCSHQADRLRFENRTTQDSGAMLPACPAPSEGSQPHQRAFRWGAASARGQGTKDAARGPGQGPPPPVPRIWAWCSLCPAPASPVVSSSSPARLRQVSQARPARDTWSEGHLPLVQEIFCHCCAQSVLTAAAMQQQLCKIIEHFNMRLFMMYMPSFVHLSEATSARCTTQATWLRQESGSSHLEVCGPFCRTACRLGSQLRGCSMLCLGSLQNWV